MVPPVVIVSSSGWACTRSNRRRVAGLIVPPVSPCHPCHCVTHVTAAPASIPPRRRRCRSGSARSAIPPRPPAPPRRRSYPESPATRRPSATTPARPPRSPSATSPSPRSAASIAGCSTGSHTPDRLLGAVTRRSAVGGRGRRSRRAAEPGRKRRRRVRPGAHPAHHRVDIALGQLGAEQLARGQLLHGRIDPRVAPQIGDAVRDRDCGVVVLRRPDPHRQRRCWRRGQRRRRDIGRAGGRRGPVGHQVDIPRRRVVPAPRRRRAVPVRWARNPDPKAPAPERVRESPTTRSPRPQWRAVPGRAIRATHCARRRRPTQAPDRSVSPAAPAAEIRCRCALPGSPTAVRGSPRRRAPRRRARRRSAANRPVVRWFRRGASGSGRGRLADPRIGRCVRAGSRRDRGRST